MLLGRREAGRKEGSKKEKEPTCSSSGPAPWEKALALPRLWPTSQLQLVWIQSLAWELLYASGAATKKKKKKHLKNKKTELHSFKKIFWPQPQHEEFLDQGSNPCHSSDNTGSLTTKPSGNPKLHTLERLR